MVKEKWSDDGICVVWCGVIEFVPKKTGLDAHTHVQVRDTTNVQIYTHLNEHIATTCIPIPSLYTSVAGSIRWLEGRCPSPFLLPSPSDSCVCVDCRV